MVEKLSWCFFDFANSSFTTVVVTVVFADYFQGTVVPPEGWLGLKGVSLWNGVVGLSQILVLVSAPVIGAMADRYAHKKRYLFRSYLVCILATACLTFTFHGHVVAAALLFIAANVGFSTGENLVAGFLPELASPTRMGRLSGYGWAIGYVGGLAALLLALPLADEAPRWTNMTTAAFFGLAGLPTFIFLRERARPAGGRGVRSLLASAFSEIRHTWRNRSRHRDLFVFLGCVVAFQSGVYVVIANASIYGRNVIGMERSEVVQLFLALQVAAGLGALGFGHMQDRLGSKPTLALALGLWTAAAVLAWSAGDVAAYSVAGVLAGAAMGSSQAASRALVGLLCPPGREGEWFGMWGLATKAAAVLGPLVYSFVVQAVGDRTSILTVVPAFLTGLLLLMLVDVERGRRTAGRV